MTNDERRPTGLLHSADELRQLIRENPTLPLLVFAGENANTGDYSYMSCSYIKAHKGEFLDCAQRVDDCMCYTNRDEFEEDLANNLADGDYTDEEFDAAKRYLISDLKIAMDSPGRLDDFYMGQILLESSGTMEDLASAIAGVTKEQTAQAARALRLDTIYSLQGVTA